MNLNTEETIYKKELAENLWFMSRISWEDISKIVILGAYNWELTSKILEEHTELECIIYDVSKKYLDEALDNMKELKEKSKVRKKIKLTNDWNSIVKSDNTNALLIMTDMIHKVYSFNGRRSVDKWKNSLLDAGFRYIAIRDTSLTQRQSELLTGYEVLDRLFRATDKDFSLDNKLEEFQRDSIRGGAITILKNYIHFLLKYWHTTDWNTIIKENYFSYDIDEFIETFIKQYVVRVKRRYYLPYIHSKWKKDFDIDIKENTHINVLLEKVE